MGTTIDLKKKRLVGRKEIIVIVAAVVLTTAGIKASDNFFSPGEAKRESSGFCPDEMVYITSSGGGFCIDQFEASPGGECPNPDPLSQADTRANLDYRGCLPASRAGTLPWRFISQDQAAVACAKAGKRLPTNEEWYAAALGTPDKKADWSADDCQVNGNWTAQPGQAGSGKDCASAAGAYDMIGNVWEWVEGAVNDGSYEGKKLPASGFVDSTDGESFPGLTNQNAPNPDYHEDYFWIKESGLRGIARGGYWSNKSDAGTYSMYIVTPPSFVGSGMGFRCAK